MSSDEEDKYGEEGEAWYAKGIWQAPKLVRGIHFEKPPKQSAETGWSELFFDLIVVSVVSKMGSALREGILVEVRSDDVLDLGSYCFYFITLFQLWFCAVQYNTRFGAEDLSHKVILATFMLSMILASFHVTANVASEKATGFFRIIAYVYVFVTLIHLRIVKEFWNHPEGNKPRNFGIVYTAQYSLTAAVMWISSIPSIASPSNRWICIIPFFLLQNPQILIFTVVPLHIRKKISAFYMLPYTIEHMNERFGLITMIVIGEGIDCLTEEVGNEVNSAKFIIYVSMVFLNLFCIKLAYFDSVADIGSVDDHPMRIHAIAGMIFSYGHFLTSLTLALFGSAIALTTEEIFGEKEEVENDVDSGDFSVPIAYYAGTTSVLFLMFTLLMLLKVERLPNSDDARELHKKIYIFEVISAVVGSFVLFVIAIQPSFLPHFSCMGLVVFTMSLSVSVVMVDFFNKWCLAKSSSWGGQMLYIWNLVPFIRKKLPEHPLAKHPVNSHLLGKKAKEESSASAADESSPLIKA